MNTKQMETIISSIRDILRKEGITGIDSVNHCILFVISRLLNDDLCHKIGIDPQYAFNNLLKDENGDEIGDQDLYDRVYNHQKNCLVGQIMYVLGFMNIKFKLEGIYNLRLIYEKLSQLDVEKLSVKYDVIGTIYEIHLKSGTSNSIRDLGQYYTHRQVIQYMINLCDPQMKNGLIEKIVDPTMGTGGFLTMAIKYLNQKYGGQIDWVKNKDHIIGFDIDENVRNMALLNVFLETMELCKETLVKQDTLHSDMKFTHNDTILEKADIILANEPMGLKNIIYAECCERIKNMKIRGTKAEPLFLQLFMSALNDGGRCAVIVPDGVLFNESALHSGTRKYLVENFNLKKVVSLNDGFFLNTWVKTSILFFTKDGQPTKEVDFSQICLKDDQLVETSVVKVSYQQIKDTKYSLFVNKYNVEQVSKIVGMEYKKLGEICQFLPKSKRPASYGQESGQYPFYTSSQKVKRCDEADYHEECLIIGDGGGINVYIDNNFSCSDHNHILKLKSHDVNMKYVYHFLRNNVNILESGLKGSTIKNLSKSFVEGIEIPIPPLSVQRAIVDRLNVLSRNNETLWHNMEEFRQIMKYYVECQTRHEKEYKLGDICDLNNKSMKSNQYSYINYIDISSIDNGKLTNITRLEGEYPSRAKRIVQHGDILLSTVRPNLRNCVYIDQNIEHCICSTGFCVICSKNSEFLNKMIYYQIMSDEVTKYLTDNATGSQYPAVNTSIVENIKLRLPNMANQEKIVEYCDNLTQIIEKMEQQMTNNNVLMKQIIDDYLNQNQIVNEGQEIHEDVVDTIQEPNDTKQIQEPIKKLPIIQIKPKSNVSIVDVPINGEDLNKLTLPKLREIAKEKGLCGYSKLKKADLIELIKSK